MKYVLALLAGMGATLGVFAGGAVFAVAYLSAEPVAVQRSSYASATTFQAQPTKVDPSRQDFERIDSVLPPGTLTESEVTELVRKNAEQPGDGIDAMMTSSIDAQAPAAAINNREHVAWCSQRYRSYRPQNNSYTAFSGAARECVSPFSDEPAPYGEEVAFINASADGSSFGPLEQGDASESYLDPAHVRTCLQRYRSYRVEDNTYQPYGGGPRQQCE